jgi:hypothetical protein
MELCAERAERPAEGFAEGAWAHPGGRKAAAHEVRGAQTFAVTSAPAATPIADMAPARGAASRRSQISVASMAASASMASCPSWRCAREATSTSSSGELKRPNCLLLVGKARQRQYRHRLPPTLGFLIDLPTCGSPLQRRPAFTLNDYQGS